jgi:DNA repair exonuclease SbcCD ATPase subunit
MAARNGTGKTTIINALSYALYGQALSNIRKDNLVNKTNGKNMLVSLDFSVNGQEYRIERGRKPNVLRFYINNEHKAAEDEAQGDSRETQDAIERVMNMSHDMFKHVLALNTYTEPFLSLKANDQRTIIEQLLGITLLSERADAIKELNRQTKDAIQAEEFRIRAVQEANKRIEEQIESLRKRQRLWTAKRDEDVGKLEQAIADLEHINIDAEVQAHRDLEAFHVKKKALDDATRYIRQIDADDAKLNKLLDKLKTEIAALDAHKCHSCGQDLHDDKQDELKQAKQALVQETALQLLANDTQRQGHEDTIAQIGTLGTAPTVFYDSLEQALNHRNTVETLRKDLTSRQADADPYEEQISDMQGQALQVVSYDTLERTYSIARSSRLLAQTVDIKDSFVRKKIIDQNLSYLNARLTHYLDRIGLPHTVKFQNDLTVSIEELGRELDFDNLSRGERNRLDPIYVMGVP